MKRCILIFPVTLLCAAVACAQANSSTHPAAQSNSPAGQSSSSTTGGLKVRGPEAVAQQDPNRVVATIDGKQITAKQALDMLKALTPEQRQQVENRLPDVVQQIYMTDQFAGAAVKQNLEKESPWKEQLEFMRNQILARAYLTNLAKTSANSAPAPDPKQYYDSHPKEFDQVKLSGIFVSFTPPGTPASAGAAGARTEQAARDKANDIGKKLKAGTDFATLARTESDNQQVAAKGGDLGTYTMGDPSMPADLRAAIEKLQPGQISEPIQVGNSFLIVKLDSRSHVPFESVKASITQRLDGERNQEAVKQEMAKYKIQVTDPAFFNASSSPAPNAPSLQRPATGQPAGPANKPQGQR
ncbi:MAG: peptidylprolyl isomerase [Acidobacteriaceae bacterium]|nr:peptidylprolyl isomerase [Acidobacteriaceae bacterium]MBV8570879.1 peptidylprolyl isomerase [Acidobacteriaceae bacterium]